jgi:hypothetical protein
MDRAGDKADGREIAGCARAVRVSLRIRLILVWAVWLSCTVVLLLYIRHYARNLPYLDDWCLVPLITGNEPVTLKWAWAQHNEHRILIPRLILAGLLRWVALDFRIGMYFNAALMSSAAAMTIVLAHRLRGYQRLSDAVLPLSILTLAQSEILFLNYALALVLSTWLVFRLIFVLGRVSERPAWMTVIAIGTALVALPLCGGSGLVVLPPLVLWLVGYLCWGWWSDREPGGWVRAVGLSFLMACSAIVALYLSDFIRPSHHPLPPSRWAVMRTTLEFLSLPVTSVPTKFRMAASLTTLALIAVALIRLTLVAVRLPHERPRAAGLAAVIMSMMGVAVSVGVSRCGLGPGAGLASRYVPLAAPILSVLYVTWLLYSPARMQRVLQMCLLLVICANIPYGIHRAQQREESRLQLFKRVERDLNRGMTESQFLDVACPRLYPDRSTAAYLVKMLRSSGFGSFKYLRADQTNAQIAVIRTPETARR